MALSRRCASPVTLPALRVLLLVAIASAVGNDCCTECVQCAGSDTCIPHGYLCDGFLDCEGAEEENPNFCRTFLALTKECSLGEALCNSTCLGWNEICSDRDLCHPKPDFEICFAIQRSKLNRKHIVADESIQISDVGFLEDILDSGSPSSVASLINNSSFPTAATTVRPVTSSSPTTVTRSNSPESPIPASAPNQNRPPALSTTTPFPLPNLHIPPQLVKVRRPPPTAGDVNFRKPFDPNRPNIANRPPMKDFQPYALFVRPSMTFALNPNFVPGEPMFQMVPRPVPTTTSPPSTQSSRPNLLTKDGGPPSPITPTSPPVTATDNDRPTDSSTTPPPPPKTNQSSDRPTDSNRPQTPNRETRPDMGTNFDQLLTPDRPSRPNRPDRPPLNLGRPSLLPGRPSLPIGNRPLPDRLGPRPDRIRSPPNNPVSPDFLLVQYIGGVQQPVQQLSVTPSVNQPDMLTLQELEIIQNTGTIPDLLSLQELQNIINTGTIPDLLSLQELQNLQNSLPGTPPNNVIRDSVGIQEAAVVTLPDPKCCDHCLRCACSSSCIAHTQICDGVGDCPAGEDEDPSFCALVQQDPTCPAGLVSCHSECLPWAEACRRSCNSEINFEMCFVVRLNRLSVPTSEPFPPAPQYQEQRGGGHSADWVDSTPAVAGMVTSDTAPQVDQRQEEGQQPHQQQNQIEQQNPQQNDQHKQQDKNEHQDLQQRAENQPKDQYLSHDQLLQDQDQPQDQDLPQDEKQLQDQNLPQNGKQLQDQDLSQDQQLQDQDLPQNLNKLQDQNLSQNGKQLLDQDLSQDQQAQDQDLLQNGNQLQNQDTPHEGKQPQNQDQPQDQQLQDQDLPQDQQLPLDLYQLQDQDQPQDQDLTQDGEHSQDQDLPRDQDLTQDQDLPQNQDLPHDQDLPQGGKQLQDQDMPQDGKQSQDQDQQSHDQQQPQDGEQPQDQQLRPSSAPCPLLYTDLAGVCYTTLPFLVTWPVARSLCRSVTGQLAQFDDAKQLEVVSKHLLHNDYPSDFWIGGFYSDEMQAWSWINGALMPMSTPFWALMYHDECVPRKDSKDSLVPGCFHYTPSPAHSAGGYCAALDIRFFHHITDHACFLKKKVICSRQKL